MTSTNTSRVVVYERISRDPEHTAQSVRRHVKECMARVAAREREGWQMSALSGSSPDPKDPDRQQWPPGVLVDNDISAAPDASGHLKQRPEYERLMAALDRGELDVIVSTSLSRLWRSTRELFDSSGRLAATGTRVELLKDPPLDFSSVMGRAIAMLIGIIAQLEAQLAAERGQSAMLDFAERGAYHGARPFGYQMTGGGRKLGHTRALVPDPVEAPLVREAAERVADNEPLYKICADFDRRGIPTATGKRWAEVGTGSLSAVLTAYRNIGKREHQAGWRGGKRTASTLYDAAWEPILDVDLFETVREILTDPDRATAPGDHARKHLLVGFVVCGKCGARLTSFHLPRAGRKQARYVCTSQRGGCGGISRLTADTDAEVMRTIFHWLEDNGLFDAAISAAESEDVKALRAERRELERQRGKIAGLVTREVITEAEARRERRRFDADIEKISGQLARHLGGQVMDLHPERGAKFVAKWESWAADGAAGLARRREVIAALVDRVVIHPAPRGVRGDRRLVQVFPAAWAGLLADPGAAEPAALLPTDLTVAARIREWLAGQDGPRTRAEIAAGTGDPRASVHKALKRLAAGGEIEREWRPTGRQDVRAAWTYQIAAADRAA